MPLTGIDPDVLNKSDPPDRTQSRQKSFAPFMRLNASFFRCNTFPLCPMHLKMPALVPRLMPLRPALALTTTDPRSSEAFSLEGKNPFSLGGSLLLSGAGSVLVSAIEPSEPRRFEASRDRSYWQLVRAE